MSAAAVDPTRRLAPVIRLAPAKLNLTLAVVGRRADGYHALHSVMVPLALADRLSVAPGTGRDDTLHAAGFDPGVASVRYEDVRRPSRAAVRTQPLPVPVPTSAALRASFVPKLPRWRSRAEGIAAFVPFGDERFSE